MIPFKQAANILNVSENFVKKEAILGRLDLSSLETVETYHSAMRERQRIALEKLAHWSEEMGLYDEE